MYLKSCLSYLEVPLKKGERIRDSIAGDEQMHTSVFDTACSECTVETIAAVIATRQHLCKWNALFIQLLIVFDMLLF